MSRPAMERPATRSKCHVMGLALALAFVDIVHSGREVRESVYDPKHERGLKSEAKKRSERAEPRRFKPSSLRRVAKRTELAPCVAAEVAKPRCSSSVRAYPFGMLRAVALKAIFFGLLF